MATRAEPRETPAGPLPGTPPPDAENRPSYFSYITQSANSQRDEDIEVTESIEDDDEEATDSIEEGQVSDSYIATVDPEEDTQLRTLKDFLRGFLPVDLLNNKPFPLRMLQQAVHLGIYEIRHRLDPELEAVVDSAGERQHCISLEKAKFWDRPLDVDALHPDAIQKHDYKETVWLLGQVRDEIAWLIYECRRLEAHCDNARKMIAMGERKSFVYYPSPRREPEVKKENEKVESVKKEEDDEEMLDAGETSKGNGARHDSAWENAKKKEGSPDRQVLSSVSVPNFRPA